MKIYKCVMLSEITCISPNTKDTLCQVLIDAEDVCIFEKELSIFKELISKTDYANLAKLFKEVDVILVRQ